MHGTTVICVRRDSKVVMAGDGQVTMGQQVMKHTARKIRRLFNDKVLAGFAGSTADALSLFERFEGKLQEHHGNLAKASVELAKEWRKDRALRHLEALLLVADAKGTFLLSGNGDVIEPDDGICAIGSTAGTLRVVSGAGHAPAHQIGREGNRTGKHALGERNLHLYQQQLHHRGTMSRGLDGTAW